MIIFKKIRWKNFLSTGDKWIEVNLNSHKKTLVVGSNGSGKSTMLDALFFVLYGKSLRNINKSQLVNSINNKNLMVEIDFEIGSKRYKVHRGIKPNVFNIYENGELVPQEASTRDYQNVLENRILKLSYKSFSQVVVLGSSTFIPFMQLTPQHRREVIEDILDLQIFTDMNNLLKEKIKDNKSDIADVKNDINIHTKEIDIINEFLAEANKDIKTETDRYNTDIEKHKSVIEQLEHNNDVLNNKIDEIQTKIKDIKINDIDTIKIEHASCKRVLEQNNEQNQFLIEHTKCPTCEQEIDEEFKNRVVTDNEENNKKQKKLISDYEQQINEHQKKVQLRTKHQNNIDKLQSQIDQNKWSIKTSTEQIKSIQNQIKSLNINKGSNADKHKRITDINKLITSLKSSLDEHYKQKDVYDIVSICLKDTGVKAKIIKHYVKVMNELINKYLAVLEFFVKFEIDENFNESLKSRHRDTFTYDSFSEGEKMRIDLSILFTWRSIAKMRNSINTNILILDEVFDSSLDNNGIDYFMRMVDSQLKDTNTFLISQKSDHLHDKFNNVIRFSKTHNFSNLIQETA